MLLPPSLLTPSELDDLIYYSRTADLPALKATLQTLSIAHTTAQAQIVNAAIDHNSDPDLDSGPGSGSGCSLLHWPAANGSEDVLGFLISVLQPLQKGGQPESSSGLQLDPDEPDRRVELDSAEPSNTTGTKLEHSWLSSLINHQNRRGNTALHWAAVNGHLGCVKLLVAAGGDVSVRNEAGRNVRGEAEGSGKEAEGATEVGEWLSVTFEEKKSDGDDEDDELKTGNLLDEGMEIQQG